MKKLDNLADEIWGYAETGFTEEKSAEAMCKFLQEEGFTVTKGIAEMPTAYEAIYGQGKPVICFLTEYDALFGMNQVADCTEFKPITNAEDTGHGCGHHLLGCGSIDGAIKYKEYLQSTGRSGTIKVVGCPAEESGSGKAYLARGGYFNDCDIALTWHPDNFNRVVTGSSQSCISVFFHFHGVSSHAAGSPHLGRSALDAAELMNVGVNYLREHMETTDRIHYAYLNVGGKSPNVVQSECITKYYVRSKTNPVCEKLFERVINCAKGAALMTGTTVDVIFDEGLSNTVSNETLENILQDSLIKTYKFDYTEEQLAYAQSFKDTYDTNLLLGNIPSEIIDTQKCIEDIKNSPLHSYVFECKHTEECFAGSTDVGDVSWCVPTGQVNTACYSYGAGAHSWQWVAQGKSDLAHKGYQFAGSALADAAITLNQHPELIEKAWAELRSKLQGETYKCLIPEDIHPHVSNM